MNPLLIINIKKSPSMISIIVLVFFFFFNLLIKSDDNQKNEIFVYLLKEKNGMHQKGLLFWITTHCFE